jgi:hypothetical protein
MLHQIASEALLNHPPILRGIDKVPGLELGEVMRHDHGDLIPPSHERLEHEHSRSCIWCRMCLISTRKWIH